MSPTTTAGIPLEVHLGPEEWAAIQRADVLAGLTAHPKSLSPTYFYDELGCALFEAITALPEYYPTRTERAILAEHAAAIAHALPADTVVELGSGTSEKTRLLLDAFAAAGRLRRFVAFDVAEPTLTAASAAIAAEYPGTAVTGVVGDFRRHLGHLPQEGERLVAFLGGTIGNLRPGERAALLATLAGNLRPGEGFLLGTDLVKDPERLVAAYDDATGVTAAFNRNILNVLNRELGADFDVAGFEHVARWNAEEEWIEMRLRTRRAQTVRVPALGLTLELAGGEEILTEISAKFRPEKVRAELAAAGLRVADSWTDPAGDFALTLGVR